jgi:iron complex transport system ATP-binding protein
MSGLDIRIDRAGYRRRDVLRDIALKPIPAGSLVSVIGPNAAGKSTLLKAIAGLVRASGEIVLDGRKLDDLSFAERVRHVAYLPQSLPQTTTLIAYEAVFSAVRASRPEIGRAVSEAAVERVFDELAMRDLALRPLNEMSGGQRQMVGLAQIMVRTPQLLLLDEPTSALDLHWQVDVVSAVRRAAQHSGAVALVAMHDINLAIRACDHIIVLADGKILADGPPEAVLDSQLLRRAFGVEARVEICSRGRPMVLIDGVAHSSGDS